MKAKDTLNAIITYEQKANIYKLKGNIDSVISIREKLYGLYSKYGYKRETAYSLGPLIDIYAKRGNISKAKHALDLYEKMSERFDKYGKIKKGLEIFYAIKGYYYLSINDALTQTFKTSKQPPLFTEKQYIKGKGLVTLHKDVSVDKINRDWLSIIIMK